RHALHSAPGEHVEHAENAGGLGLEGLSESGRIDAGDGDIGAEPVDHEGGKREPDALFELFGLGKGAKIQVGGKLLGGGNHLPLLGPHPPRATRAVSNMGLASDPRKHTRNPPAQSGASGLPCPRPHAPYSSLAAALGLVVLAFLAADFLPFSSSAGSTFFSMSAIDPPALSIAALAPAVA